MSLKISKFVVQNVQGQKYLNAKMLNPKTGFNREYSIACRDLTQDELIAKAKENREEFISKLRVSEKDDRVFLSYNPNREEPVETF